MNLFVTKRDRRVFFVVVFLFFSCRLRWSTPLKTLWISKCVYKTQPHVQKILCHIWTKIVPTRRLSVPLCNSLRSKPHNVPFTLQPGARGWMWIIIFFYVLLQLHLEKLDRNPGGVELKSSGPAHLFIWSRSVRVLSGCIFGTRLCTCGGSRFFHAHMDHGSYFWIFVLKVYSQPSSVASCSCS